MSDQVDVGVLRTLHRILRQQADLRQRLEHGPRRMRAADAAEAEFTKKLEEARELCQKNKISSDQKQLQLREREAKIDDLKRKLNSCESNREYQLLKDQIAADLQANNVLSDEILEQLERIDQLEAQIKVAQGNLEKAKTESATLQQSIASERSIVEADLQRVEQERVDAESKLPPEIRAEYRRMTQSVGENALAAVEDNTCGNCYTMLTPQIINDLRLSHSVFCKRCGSLLYFSENATV